MDPSFVALNVHCALDCVVVEGTGAVRPTKHKHRAADPDIFALFSLLSICLGEAAQIDHAVSRTRLVAKQRRCHGAPHVGVCGEINAVRFTVHNS